MFMGTAPGEKIASEENDYQAEIAFLSEEQKKKNVACLYPVLLQLAQ